MRRGTTLIIASVVAVTSGLILSSTALAADKAPDISFKEEPLSENIEGRDRGAGAAKLSDIVAALNGKEGYDFSGFSMNKSDLLTMLDVARERATSKLENGGKKMSQGRKESLEQRIEALNEAKSIVSEGSEDILYLTDEKGKLITEEGSLYQVLELMVNGAVESVKVDADWEKIVKVIHVNLGDGLVSLYYKDGEFFADQKAQHVVADLEEFDAYHKKDVEEASVMADTADGHFSGICLNNAADESKILLADHEGKFVYDEEASERKIEDFDEAYALRSRVISINEGELNKDFYTDGEVLYADKGLTEPLYDFASIGSEFFADNEEGHFGGYRLGSKDGALFADHEGNLACDELAFYEDQMLYSIRTHFLTLVSGDSEKVIYSDGERVYLDPEMTTGISSVTELYGDFLNTEDGHLLAYYLVDGDDFSRDAGGDKVAVVNCDGDIVIDAVDEDRSARAVRYHVIDLYAGEDMGIQRTLYYSDGSFYTDDQLECIVGSEDGDIEELFEDSDKGHFAGIYLLDDEGEMALDGEGNRVTIAFADGSLRDYADIPASGDFVGRALYYRHGTMFRGDDRFDDEGNSYIDGAGDDGNEDDGDYHDDEIGTDFYSDDSMLYENSELTEVMDKIDLPELDLDEVHNWYAFDEMGEDNLVQIMRFEPVIGQKLVVEERSSDNENSSEDGDGNGIFDVISFGGSDEESEGEVRIEDYLAGYVAYNINGEAIFVVDPDGNIDYESTEIVVEDIDMDALNRNRKDDEEAASSASSSSSDDASAATSASSGASVSGASSASSGASVSGASSASSTANSATTAASGNSSTENAGTSSSVEGSGVNAGEAAGFSSSGDEGRSSGSAEISDESGEGTGASSTQEMTSDAASYDGTPSAEEYSVSEGGEASSNENSSQEGSLQDEATEGAGNGAGEGNGEALEGAGDILEGAGFESAGGDGNPAESSESNSDSDGAGDSIDGNEDAMPEESAGDENDGIQAEGE